MSTLISRTVLLKKVTSLALLFLPLSTKALLNPSKGFARQYSSPSLPARQETFRSLHMSAPETTNDATAGLNLASGIEDIIADYDVFLLDMWGVMHDGFTAYDGVIECVEKLRKAGKELIILSNSSQRKENSIKNLKGLGFDPLNDFAKVITSGEVAFQLLSGEDLGGCQPWDILKNIQTENAKEGRDNKIFVLGTNEQRDVPYIEGAGWKFAPIEEADLILACGTFAANDGTKEVNKRDDPEEYEAALKESLEKGAARKLPFLVSNPDKVRPDYERPPMPGALGDMYEKALMSNGLSDSDAEALVKRIGKPFRDVYDIALKDTPDKSRACMVGDSLETDITGGGAAGIATVWILKDGVYIPELEDADAKGKTLLEAATEILVDFNGNKANTYAKGGPDQSPSVALPHFRW